MDKSGERPVTHTDPSMFAEIALASGYYGL